jgi:hypothetical protein
MKPIPFSNWGLRVVPFLDRGLQRYYAGSNWSYPADTIRRGMSGARSPAHLSDVLIGFRVFANVR